MFLHTYLMKYSTVLLCAAPLISDTPNLAVIGQIYFAKVVQHLLTKLQHKITISSSTKERLTFEYLEILFLCNVSIKQYWLIVLCQYGAVLVGSWCYGSVYGGTGWYLVVLGQSRVVLVDI